MKKLVIGVSGASGVHLAKRFIESLPKDIKIFLIASDGAKLVSLKERNILFLDDANVGEITASGSFINDGMIILPCSMNTLAKIACGISDTLITRSASVMLKERRKLLLAPREMPFGTIALENMHKLSTLGAIIAPPIPGYYAKPNSLEEMEDFMIGKWMDCLNIPHNLYKRWQG